MGILDRIFGRRDSGADSDTEGADRKPRQEGKGKEVGTTLSSEEQRQNLETASRISEMARRASAHVERIAARQVRDVPSLEGLFAQVRGLWSEAENLYSGMKHAPGAELPLTAQSAIGELRRYKEALDRAKAAHWGWQQFPKTYRSGGELEMRSDFDARTSPEREYQAPDVVEGAKYLREVMGL